MKVKILITTAPGQAAKNEFVMRKVIAGIKKFRRFEMYLSKKDDRIIWEIEDNPKRILGITRKVAMFETLIKMAMNTYIVKKMAKRLTPDDKKVWEQMLKEQTKVEIIKEATAEELVEGNKTYWTKLKEKFKKKT